MHDAQTALLGGYTPWNLEQNTLTRRLFQDKES